MRELGALSSSTERRSALLMLGRCELVTAMPGFLKRLVTIFSACRRIAYKKPRARYGVFNGSMQLCDLRAGLVWRRGPRNLIDEPMYFFFSTLGIFAPYWVSVSTGFYTYKQSPGTTPPTWYVFFFCRGKML